MDRWKISQASASVILANEKPLLAFGDVIKKINTATPRLQQLTEEIASLKLAAGASARAGGSRRRSPPGRRWRRSAGWSKHRAETRW